MSVLLTGGGLVGARAAELLVERGEQVVLFDAAPSPRLLGEVAGLVELVQGDLLQLPELLGVVKRFRPSRILHTAGLLTPAGQERPYLTVQVNLVGTANVLEAARLEGVRRVVFTSSATVYDSDVPSGPLLSEEHPLRPGTVYSATKLAGEHLGRSYGALYGFEFVVVRFAAVYGPAISPGGGVSRVVHDALLSVLRTGQAQVRRRWSGRQDLVYSRDAAAGLVAAAFAEGLEHDVFNIGSGRSYRVEDVASLVGELTGSRVEIVEPQGLAESNPRGRIEAPLDLGRAERELGYRPGYDLGRGMAEMVEWMRKELL